MFQAYVPQALNTSDPDVTTSAMQAAITAKQDVLVSGTNIKTINNTPLLGSGDIVITGGTGDALVADPLSQFAATTSAQLRGVISDETGTGALVFAGGDIGAATGTSLAASGTVSAASIGIGTASPLWDFQISSTFATVLVDRYSGDTGGSSVIFRKARGTSASPSGVLSGDQLGGVIGRGYHSLGGFTSSASAAMNIVAAENFATPFAVGAYIQFETVAVGSSSRSERMRLNASGGLSIGTTIDAGSQNLLVNNKIVANDSIKFGPRTIATLPIASTVSGESYRVTDSPVSNSRIATSDGTDWHYEGLAYTVGTTPTSGVVGAFSFKIDTQATGAKKLYFRVPYACTIASWEIVGDASGSCVIDIWKDTYANYPPVVGDSITASAKPTISAAVKAQSSTLTGWTTSLAAGDYIEVNVDSVTTITNVTLTLNVTRT